MDTFKKLRKRKRTVYLLLGIAVLLIPAVIWLIYFMSRKGHISLYTSLSEAEAYIVYAAVLVFLSSILLSYLTFSQNQFANRINERQQELEGYRLKLETQPAVLVCSWNLLMGAEVTSLKISYIKGSAPNQLMVNYFNASLSNSDISLEIRLINTSNSFVMITYKSAVLLDREMETELFEQPVNRKICLNPTQEGTLFLCFNEEDLSRYSEKKLKLNLTLENRFGERYVEAFCLYLRELTKKGENAWSFDIIPQEYSLKKILDHTTLSKELMNPFDANPS